MQDSLFVHCRELKLAQALENQFRLYPRMVAGEKQPPGPKEVIGESDRQWQRRHNIEPDLAQILAGSTS